MALATCAGAGATSSDRLQIEIASDSALPFADGFESGGLAAWLAALGD